MLWGLSEDAKIYTCHTFFKALLSGEKRREAVRYFFRFAVREGEIMMVNEIKRLWMGQMSVEITMQ
jgi:hypothetical protein